MRKYLTIGIFFCSAQAFAAMPVMDLLQVVKNATVSDPAFYAALNTGRSTEEGVAIARAALLPQIDGQYQWSKNTTTYPGFKQRNAQTSLSANVAQSVINVANWENYSSAKKSAQAAKMTIRYAFQTLLSGVSIDYFQLASAEKMLQIQRDQLETYKKIYQLSKQRYAAGQSLLSDVLMSRTAMISSKTTLFTDKKSVTAAISHLSEHLSIPVKKVAPIKGRFMPSWKSSYDIGNWKEKAIKYNPNIQAMHFNMLAQKKMVDAARAAYVPSLSSEFSYNKTDSNGNYLGKFDTTSETIEFGLKIPIFQGGAMFSAIKKQLDLFYASRDNWVLTKKQTLSALSAAAEAMKEDVRIIKQQYKSIGLYKKNLSVILMEYNLGNETMTSVQNAVMELYGARSSLAEAQYQFLQDYVTCKFQIGMLSIKDIKAINEWMKQDA